MTERCPETGPPRRQARGLATRQRLLESAEWLFSRRGYEGTSIGDVADKAGVGVGTVYHHFADKRALLLELIARWAARLEAEPQSEEELRRFLGDDARARLGDWLKRSYERLRGRPSLYLVALAAAERDGEVARAYRRVEARTVARIETLLEVGQTSGQIRADLDRASAAFLIHHALDVAATQLLVRRPTDLDAERVVDELADMICRYILSPQSR